MTNRTITLTPTDAGLAAMGAANLAGLAVNFSHLAIGDGLTPLPTTATALTSERERQTFYDAVEIAPTQWQLLARFDGDPGATYPVTELALIGDGVVFATWVASNASEAIVYRQNGAPWNAKIPYGTAGLPSQNISFQIQPLDNAMAQIMASHNDSANPHPDYVSGKLDQTAKTADFRKIAQGNVIPAGRLVASFADAFSAEDRALVCNGATVSRATYARLFAKIGIKYGAGNGSTTFTLPNIVDGDALLAGGTVGEVVAGEVIGHTHTGASDSGGGHGHTGSTNAGGNHVHSLLGGASGGNQGAPGMEGGATGWYPGRTSAGGNHVHSLTINAVSGHIHALAISTTGGAKNQAAGMKLLIGITY